MSVAEIKEEVARLTSEERRELVRAILLMEEDPGAGPKTAGNFQEAKAYVFSNYGELLRRLAQ